jgi:hypothetical protein
MARQVFWSKAIVAFILVLVARYLLFVISTSKYLRNHFHTSANFGDQTFACVKAKAVADAIYAANVVTAQSKLSWPVIMNASLFVVDRNYIDGWVIKGTDIVSSAIFEESPESHSLHLIDARGSTVPCKAQQHTWHGTRVCVCVCVCVCVYVCVCVCVCVCVRVCVCA